MPAFGEGFRTTGYPSSWASVDPIAPDRSVPFSNASSANRPLPTLVTSNPAQTRLKLMTPDSAMLSSHTRIFAFSLARSVGPSLRSHPACTGEPIFSQRSNARFSSTCLSAAYWPDLCCDPNIQPNLQAQLEPAAYQIIQFHKQLLARNFVL